MANSLYTKIEIAEAIENLKYISRWWNIDITSTLESKELAEYLSGDLDDSNDVRFEKVFSIVIFNIARKQGYPTFVAKKVSSYCEQDLRREKLEVLKSSDRISAKRYDDEKKKLKYVEFISKATRRASRIGAKAALSSALHYITGGTVIEIMKWSGEPVTMSIGWIAFGIMTAYDFLVPSGIKRQISNHVKKTLNYVVDNFKGLLQKLHDAREKVAIAIYKAIDAGIKKVTDFVQDTSKKMVEGITNVCSSIKNKIIYVLKKTWIFITA